MKIPVSSALALAAAAALALWQVARADTNPVRTTITVPKMHCMGCAKRMADQLYKVPGVAVVRANAGAKTLFVEPKAQQVVSPRALWEAVERAGFQPSRLKGPSGTFTSKPRS